MSKASSIYGGAMTRGDQFDDIFELALDTAGRLFESSGLEPDPSYGMDLLDLVEVCQSAQEAGRTRAADTCPMPEVAQTIPTATTPATDDLVTAVRAGLDTFTWFRSAKVPTDFVAKSCAAELVGPDGAYHADDIRFGLFLIGPNADYPQHRHAPHENYLVIAGTGQWDVGEGWEAHSAGDIVAMSPDHPHALRTADSAVLMLYTWTGPDISFDTYELG